ncbi:YciI family protein [Micromonospora sp. NPDC048898]|uniref:YciI family protein n=1 Tax=Micromonospora sp. NPDC048898 TaxID=3364260 RepID=UPI003713F208
MAKYMILIYGDAQQWDAMTDEQWKAHDAAHVAFVAEAGARILGGQQLEPAPTATSLRADALGQLDTTDGPFLETKEALGGYYLLEAADLDEVLSLAALLPEVRAAHSGVEIRPVVDHG